MEIRLNIGGEELVFEAGDDLPYVKRTDLHHDLLVGEKHVMKTKKIHVCVQCGKMIPEGSSAYSLSFAIHRETKVAYREHSTLDYADRTYLYLHDVPTECNKQFFRELPSF